MFVRIYTVSPKRHELFAIRYKSYCMQSFNTFLRSLLFHVVGPTCFKDLRTVEGVEYSTFTEAAMRLRLLESDSVYAGAMDDACADIMALSRLQHYFAMLLFHCKPSDPQTLFDRFLDQMRPHKAGIDHNDPEQSRLFRRGEVLKSLEYFFNCMDTSCRFANTYFIELILFSEIGLLGLPIGFDFAEQAKLMADQALMDDFFAADGARNSSLTSVVIADIQKLNIDQRKAFDRICAAITGRGEQRCFFVEGAGGCGKTFLYNTLIRWCLAGKPDVTVLNGTQGIDHFSSGSVISAASTGIAALLLIGGGTVHRQFSVPNDVDDLTPPRLSFESAGAKRLRDVDLLIIDVKFKLILFYF